MKNREFEFGGGSMDSKYAVQCLAVPGKFFVQQFSTVWKHINWNSSTDFEYLFIKTGAKAESF